MDYSGRAPVIPKPMPTSLFDAITITIFSFAALTTAIRFYLWIFVLRTGKLDSYLILIGTLATLGLTILSHYAVLEINALGAIYRSLEDPRNPQEVESRLVYHSNRAFRYSEIADFIYLFALPIIKCAILAFYRKIIVKRSSRYLLYAFGLVMILQGVGNFLASVIATEISGSLWNVLSSSNELLESTTHQVINSCFQVVFDIGLLIIPVPVLLTLKIRSSAKVGLFVVYAISFVSLAATTIRLVKVIGFYNASDETSGQKRIEHAFWALVEACTAIFCANLPALSSLLRIMRGRVQTTDRKTSTAPSSSGGAFKAVAKSFAVTRKSHTTQSVSEMELTQTRTSGANDNCAKTNCPSSESLNGVYHGFADEEDNRAQTHGGGHSKPYVITDGEQNSRGIHKTYEFSAKIEKGLAKNDLRLMAMSSITEFRRQNDKRVDEPWQERLSVFRGISV